MEWTFLLGCEELENPLGWIRDRIRDYYPDVHAGILQKYGVD